MALSPDASGEPLLRMPTCWRLELEDGWFRKTSLPHLARQHSRTLWRICCLHFRHHPEGGDHGQYLVLVGHTCRPGPDAVSLSRWLVYN